MYEYSAETLQALKDVVFKPVLSRSVDPDRLGFPVSIIRDQVLEKGRADFTQDFVHSEHGSLTATDRCLLYAFFNLKHHYQVARHHLENQGRQVGLPSAEPTLFIDLGSGPGTALLAYADTWPQKRIDYIAIDRAPGMLLQAQQLFDRLKLYRAIHPSSTFASARDWNGLSVPLGRHTIMFASFLFASPWMDEVAHIAPLVTLTTQILAARGANRFWFIYTNSDAPIANGGWARFCSTLGLSAPPSLVTIEGKRYSGTILSSKPPAP